MIKEKVSAASGQTKKFFHSILTPLMFFLRASKLRRLFKKMDENVPFEGPIGSRGVYETSLSPKSIAFLENEYKKYDGNRISISDDYAEFMDDLMRQIGGPVSQYLGVWMASIGWLPIWGRRNFQSPATGIRIMSAVG